MSSTTKTLQLLSYFTATRPEIGLSQFCRLAHRDKATTFRHLQALEDAGFVEKNPVTKRYRLGPAVLQLAQMREITVPRKEGAEGSIAALAEATGETAHVVVLSGTTLFALAACESTQHSARAIIDIQTFPLHATATGLCSLAFGPPDLMNAALSDMQAFTAYTVTTPDGLADAVAQIRATGFGRSDLSYEDEIQSLSAPVFDHTNQLAGSVAVASVSTRFTPTQERCIQENLVIASRNITRNWGGTVPDTIEALWAATLSKSNALESAS